MPRGDKNRKLTENDIQRMIELYNSQRPDGRWYSTKDLQNIFGIQDSAILYHLRKNGVCIRSNSQAHFGWNSKPVTRLPSGDPPLCLCGCGQPVEWHQSKNTWYRYVQGHYRKDAPYKNREWLLNAYVTHLRSVQEIADECNVSQGAILKAMQKHKIERRPVSDSLALRESMRGEKNPSWKGGVSKWLYAFNWKRIAGSIRKRDNYTCQKCGQAFPKSSRNLHVHHIDGDKQNNKPENLVTLCHPCHPLGKRAEAEFAKTFHR